MIKKVIYLVTPLLRELVGDVVCRLPDEALLVFDLLVIVFLVFEVYLQVVELKLLLVGRGHWLGESQISYERIFI